MTVSRQSDPRANQKARTRTALVAAAEELLRRGNPPTVSEAAEHARISRATAYRYFPSQEALLVEAGQINPAMKVIEDFLESLDSAAFEENTLALQDKFNRLVLKNELAMRTLLHASLGTWLATNDSANRPAIREGRRMRWLDHVLQPARKRISKKAWERLRAALALTLSIEAIVVMKDVCHLDNEEALSVLRWTASTLLQVALKNPK
jgi:AcrR family transcriptional regulator